MKKLSILTLMVVGAITTVGAGNLPALSASEEQAPVNESAVREKSDLEWEIYWDKYIKSYFVRFYNNTSKHCEVYYEIWNGRKWIDGAGVVSPYRSSSFSAGDYGKIRNIDPHWK